MKTLKYISVLLFAISIASCSDYNKIVKSDDYALKLATANDYYERGAVVGSDGKVKVNDNTVLRSITLYEQIYQRMPKTGEGELSYFRIGKAYYYAEDYYMAGYYLGVFPQRFPYSAKGEEAMFLSAMCGVKNSPESTLDQNETEVALNDLQLFIDHYPDSPLIDSCNHIIDRLRTKLETKSFSAVLLYSETESYRAAVSSALTFIEDYPLSSFNEEVNYLLIKNSTNLAINSVEIKKMERIEESIERYRNFVSLYSESKYIKSLSIGNDKMEKLYKEYTNTENI